jgi:hypothetical protein
MRRSETSGASVAVENGQESRADASGPRVFWPGRTFNLPGRQPDLLQRGSSRGELLPQRVHTVSLSACLAADAIQALVGLRGENDNLGAL